MYKGLNPRSSYIKCLIYSETNLSPGAIAKSLASDFNGIDWMAQQNGGQFDPELFGDYRDPQDNILNGEFGGFFSDAFPVQDFTSPFFTGDIATPAAQKRDLMQEVEKQRSGNDDDVAINGQPKKILNCTQLWYVPLHLQDACCVSMG